MNSQTTWAAPTFLETRIARLKLGAQALHEAFDFQRQSSLILYVVRCTFIYSLLTTTT